MDSSEGSVTQWLDGLKKGEGDCARRLYGDVYDRLVRLARRRLTGQTPRFADEEDIALSAFHSFCQRAADGRFPQLENRDDLWKILVRITTRKAKDYLRASKRQKRGGGAVRGESVFFDNDSSSPAGLHQAAANEETPEMLAIVAEECCQLLQALGDENLAQIAVWKMEGFTDVQIADRLGCVVRTVERKTERIREKWAKVARLDPGNS